MKFFPTLIAAAVAAAAGCSAKPLQPTGSGGGSIMTGGGGDVVTGGGGISTTGAGGAAASGAGGDIATGGGGVTGGGGSGGSTGLPFAGHRSYVVGSAFSALDGGAVPVPSHTFTMVIDADHAIAIFGAPSSASTSPVQPTQGGFHIVAPPGFVLTSTVCGGRVSYTDLHFTFNTIDSIVGAGRAQLTTYNGDLGQTVNVSTSLTGVLDTVPPTLTLASDDLANPFLSFSIDSAEPLPEQTHPLLRSASGDAIVLSSVTLQTGGIAAGSPYFISRFSKPQVLLRFGDSYQFDFDTGLVDFAFNRTTGADWSFKTRAAPPLVAADGFESITSTTLDGAQILSAAGDPIIDGTRSLYVPPVGTAGMTRSTMQFALRLPVAPGRSTLFFKFRNVNAGPTTAAYFAIASVGGSIVTGSPASGSDQTTATIGETAVTLGPLTNAAIALPPDAGAEIVFARIVPSPGSCVGPMPPTVPGVIIDDLSTQ